MDINNNIDGYDTGDYCNHWHELGTCDEICEGCNHPCNLHDAHNCRGEDDTCICVEFKDFN